MNRKFKIIFSFFLFFLSLLIVNYAFRKPNPFRKIVEKNEALANLHSFIGKKIILVAMPKHNKQAVLQCLTDLAGSEGLVFFNKTFAVIEGEKCYLSDENNPNIREISKDDCLEMMEKTFFFFISDATPSAYFQNGIAIGIKGNYSFGQCKVVVAD